MFNQKYSSSWVVIAQLKLKIPIIFILNCVFFTLCCLFPFLPSIRYRNREQEIVVTGILVISENVGGYNGFFGWMSCEYWIYWSWIIDGLIQSITNHHHHHHHRDCQTQQLFFLHHSGKMLLRSILWAIAMNAK